MDIENMAVNALRPYANNARTHSKKQIKQIENSIKQFGFNNPILVDDQLQIIAGHGRWQAAKQLGLETVPVVRLSHLSEADKKAYILADNKLAENAGWDRDILAIELQGLIDVGISVEEIGFTVPEVDLLLEEAQVSSGPATGPEDDLGPSSDGPPVTGPGILAAWFTPADLCRLGDPAAYKELLQGQKAQFVFTDPPYNVKVVGNVCGRETHHEEFAMASGEMTEFEFTGFLSTVFRLMANNSVDG